MKTEKEINYVVELEKAIAKKYGDETIINPKSGWNDEKEQNYQEQAEKLYKKEHRIVEKYEKVNIDGVLLPKKLLNREAKRKCPVCAAYSFKKRDDLYMNKFECCFECYVQWVERREERWLEGWRPNNETKKKQKEN